MGKVLLALLVLGMTFYAGFAAGGSRKKKALSSATEHVRPVIVAARNFSEVDWLNNPNSAVLARSEMIMALDEYDAAQRRALT